MKLFLRATLQRNTANNCVFAACWSDIGPLVASCYHSPTVVLALIGRTLEPIVGAARIFAISEQLGTLQAASVKHERTAL